jgi:hypothetical protein
MSTSGRAGNVETWQRRVVVTLVAGALAIGGCDSKGAKGSGDQDLTGAEIKDLFAGKTVEGHHERKGYDFQSYYEPEGELRSYQGPEKKLHPGKWWVKGDDICIRWEGTSDDLCRKMVKDAEGNYRKEKVRGNGSRLVVVTFESFVKGNPHSL